MPSGSLRPSLTIVFKSEPSGLHESTRPSLRSKTNRRPKVAFVVPFEDFDFEALEDIEFTCSFLRSICKSNSSARTSKRLAFQNALDERAEAGYGFPDDQILHLERAFIGIERFGIRKETGDVIVDNDSVAAK